MLLINYIQNQFPLVLSQESITDKLNKLNQMINNTLRHAPTKLSTQGSEHYSAHYQRKYDNEHEDTLLMTWFVGKITYSISILSLDSKSKLSFWSSLPENEEQAKELYLLQHALLFKATGFGDCSYRASYSAIELAKVFLSAGMDIEVKVRSYPEIDQFVVMIGSHQHGWKIYDPLTNPELIFDEEEYNASIKPLFKSVNTPGRPYEFTITRKEINRAESLFKKMIYLLQTESDKLSLTTLKVDANYLNFLQLNGISDPSFQKTSEVIQNLRTINYDGLTSHLDYESPYSGHRI